MVENHEKDQDDGHEKTPANPALGKGFYLNAKML